MTSKRPKRPAQPDPPARRRFGIRPHLHGKKMRLAAVRRQAAELREENLRLLAEMQNLRKRTEREQDETVRFAESRARL